MNLKALMAAVFECEEIDIDEDAMINDTIGWGSLSHINLILALEQNGVEVSPLQIADLTSYESIHHFLTEAGVQLNG